MVVFGAEDRPTLPGQMELAKVFAVNMTLVHKSLLLRFGRNLNNTTVQFNISTVGNNRGGFTSLKDYLLDVL